MKEKKLLIVKISKRAIEISNRGQHDLQRSCWTAVHEYMHGFTPVEYDIREINEDLYLAVLRYVHDNIEK